jgi:hypothetical protein
MQNPIIEATIRNAGTITGVVARNIMLDRYTALDRDGVPAVDLAAQWIANAVVDDTRGSCALNDRHILADRDQTPGNRQAAGERQDLRVMVGTVLMQLANTDVEGWRRFIDQLAGRPAAVQPQSQPL